MIAEREKVGLPKLDITPTDGHTGEASPARMPRVFQIHPLRVASV